MLNQLNSPDVSKAENMLGSLRQVMAIKSRVVLPYLVSQFISQPGVVLSSTDKSGVCTVMDQLIMLSLVRSHPTGGALRHLGPPG